jgi:hypothetical protein
MKTKVKIIDFNRRTMRCEQAEAQLSELLDEGYSIVTSTDNGTFASYTLVMQNKISFDEDETPAAAVLTALSASDLPRYRNIH